MHMRVRAQSAEAAGALAPTLSALRPGVSWCLRASEGNWQDLANSTSQNWLPGPCLGQAVTTVLSHPKLLSFFDSDLSLAAY